jgi:hypothetical protein
MQFCTFTEYQLFWPERSLDEKEIGKCVDVFVATHKEVANRLKHDFERDARVYRLCKERMGSRDVQPQFLRLNVQLLDNLRKHFPEEHPPLGVYISAEEIPFMHL